MTELETEVKFFVQDLKKIELSLQTMEAHLVQPRIHEINYRYDLPDGSLRAREHVLRLRQDTKAILTFKGSSDIIGGVFSRTELETTVGDLETAQHILEALGYVRILTYEKYRAVYDVNDCHIMLDELPYGDFVEIEGPDVLLIQAMATHLGLSFEYAVGFGYSRIFENYASNYGLPPSDLTFAALQGKKPSPEELNVRAAD